MKKGVLFSIVFVLAIASLLSVFQFTGYATVSITSPNGSVQKISDSVYNNIQANGSTDVLIKVIPGRKKIMIGFLTFSSGFINKTQAESEVKSDLKNVSYSKDGLIYAKINSSELAKIESSDNIESVTPERVFHVDSQDPTAEINVSSVQSVVYKGENLTGTGETVCILDTGIDYNNANFGGCYGDNNVSSGCRVIGGYNFINNTPYPLDDNGHGTHVAGIIGASGSLTGVAPGVKIISIKVCDASGSCSESNIQKGIDWCVNNASKFNITVISMSLGTPQLYSGYCNTDTLASSINSAVAENISFVVASGNDANATAMASPACVQNATSVGDTYVESYVGTFSWGSPVVCSDTNPVKDEIVCHSNRDSVLDLLAPGALINSTWLNNGYQLEGGTSMATPHVAGAIAILKQYESLNGKPLNSSQAEQALNDTGVPIYDSVSGLTFPNIDVYSALFYLDNDSPSVTLVSPLNKSVVPESNQTFDCNATDLLLNNATLRIWNSTGLYYNVSENFTGQSNSSSFNVSMVYGNYNWNCFYEDSKNNIGYASNYTLKVSPGVIYLSPENNTYSNQNGTFLCNSTYFIPGVNISNVTFDIFNSSTLLHNETVNVSGSSNLTSFSYNFTKEENYFWGCYFYSNDSNLTQSENYTFTYDLTSPSVNVSLPANNTVLDGGTQDVTFVYNVTDNFALGICDLELNGNNVSSDSNLTSGENNFSYSVSPGSYLWIVNCSDLAGNYNSSEPRNITVNEVQSSPSSSSPSTSTSVPAASSGASAVQNNISEGYSVSLTSGSSHPFVLSDSGNHTLTVNGISGPSANITVRSEPVNFVLYVGQDKYLNLSSPDYYDLYVRLNGISNGVANITIQELTSNNRIFHIVSQPSSNETNTTGNNNGFGLNSNQIYLIFGVLAVVLIFIIILVVLNRKKKKSRKKVWHKAKGGRKKAVRRKVSKKKLRKKKRY